MYFVRIDTYLEMGIQQNTGTCSKPTQPSKCSGISPKFLKLFHELRTFNFSENHNFHTQFKPQKRHRWDFLEIINRTCRMTCCKLTRVNYDEGVGLLQRWGDGNESTPKPLRTLSSRTWADVIGGFHYRRGQWLQHESLLRLP